MNILILDVDIKKIAQYHNDKHILCAIIDTTRLLCDAYYNMDDMQITRTFPRDGGFYKLTHRNHPCAKWTRFSMSNWEWLLSLLEELCNEYRFRYEKTHAVASYIPWFKEHKPELPDYGMTPFVKAMPDDVKFINDAVDAYREYYVRYKQHLATWKKRTKPFWFNKQ